MSEDDLCEYYLNKLSVCQTEEDVYEKAAMLLKRAKRDSEAKIVELQHNINMLEDEIGPVSQSHRPVKPSLRTRKITDKKK